MNYKYFDSKSVLKPQIKEVPSQDLSLVVVIPAMNEPDLLASLEALKNCHKPNGDVEVIVIINHCDGATHDIVKTNQDTFTTASKWASLNSTNSLRFHILFHPDLSAKKGGVGMARKTGMDEAARRLFSVNNAEGVISCFDADCGCDQNYLMSLIDFFKAHPEKEGVSINFEHPVAGLPRPVHEAIVNYELHLRYYIDTQRWAGFPFAFQTVGSSMAIRASTYLEVGGMNTRKAGEDFYFLHKVIERGAHADLMTTTVYPSARSSDRVPFGTGKAVADLVGGASPTTYSPESFKDLRLFIANVPKFYSTSDLNEVMQKLPASIREFLAEQRFEEILKEIKGNTASQESFEKRFFRWFNAFRLMKYVHFSRDNFYPDVPIIEAVDWLTKEIGEPAGDSLEDKLMIFRKLDVETGFKQLRTRF